MVPLASKRGGCRIKGFSTENRGLGVFALPFSMEGLCPKLPYDWPERRYEVFLSSTYEDLKDLRKALMNETTTCGHLASGMEFFARGARDVDLIRERIRRADIFVILVGARYGSVVRQNNAHFIDLEYDIASELGKPTLAYLLEEGEYNNARSALPEGDSERQFDVQLKQFRERVRQFSDGGGRIVGAFSLKGKHSEILAEYDRDLSRAIVHLAGTGGWVRGEAYDDIRNRVGLEEAVSTNPFFRKFVAELSKFDILSDRIVRKVPELKTSIAKFFWDQYLGQMIESGIGRFFFESGSSIAFLSDQFMRALHDEQWLKEQSPKLELHTNNILTYIDFTLSEAIRIELFPYGSPEKKYGATFGRLTSLPKLQPPKSPRKLTRTASEIVTEMTEWITSRYKNNGVILMTASGLEVSSESPFYGPHVGSYYNMLFKKALLSAACPTVMFLDDKEVARKPI